MNENCVHGVDVANVYCPECGKNYRGLPSLGILETIGVLLLFLFVLAYYFGWILNLGRIINSGLNALLG